jgi:PAS domain S-box-containing protein
MRSTIREKGALVMKRKLPVLIAMAYALIGGLWILLSDHIVETVTSDPALISRFQTIKGWVFIAATALGLYLIMRSVESLYQKQYEAEMAIVSERREAGEKLKESEKRYRLLAENISDMISRHDLEGRYLYVSPSCRQLLSYGAEELIGHTVYELIHPEDIERVKENHLKLLEQAGALTVSFRLHRKDGEYVWVESTATAMTVPDSESVNDIIVITRDITERKKAEEMRVAKEEVEYASQAKSDFMAGMSHELRTPLNAIIGFSEILQDQYFGKLNEKQSEYINDILESGKHLLSLINDILDISKIEAGKTQLDLSAVHIKGLFENSLIMIKEKAFKHRIRLNLHIPEELAGLNITIDERKLKQILFNLLSNAAKFTPDGGAITVSAVRQNGNVLISVSDTGIGVEKELQERIFEPFYQAQSGLKDKTPGTGLGLSLSKRLVEMHGGRIWVESKGNGKGSTFFFTLPVNIS